MEYRAPEKGRKACTFKLKAEVKKVLASLAKKNDTSETDMLSMLISDGASAHAGLREQLDKLKEKAKKLRQGNNAAMDLFEFTAAMLCRTEVLLHDALSTVAITQDQERRIGKLRKQVWDEANADIAASADETAEMRLRTSGRLYNAMREEKRISRPVAVASKTAENTSTTAQAGLNDLQPVTYVKPKSQHPPEAKEKTNSAATDVGATPLINHSTKEYLEMKDNENYSPHFETDAPPPPQAATQSPHRGGISLTALGVSFANKKIPVVLKVKPKPN
ncbi:hypothetical protein [Pseudomonas sp. MWU13-2105]|uniref:hypothetical protein n=1 Tax=Pseudomonas sp. MWU13-2105 TaxID=2935074 RepID=UPI00200D2AB1|nr:hypothetical protein [Pseudomonas sp. MWU13-2105]